MLTCMECKFERKFGNTHTSRVLYLATGPLDEQTTTSHAGIDVSLNDLLAFRAKTETLTDHMGKCENPDCPLFNKDAYKFQQKVREPRG